MFNEKRKSVKELCALNLKYSNLPMSNVQLTKSAVCLCSFPYIILSCYNDITKKTYLIPYARSKPLYFSSLKTNMVGMIKIITTMITHTLTLWIKFKQLSWTFKHWDNCIYVSGIKRYAEKIVNFRHVVCETIRRKKLLKLSKLYEVNHVEYQ